jgi:hypothetical protein
MQEHPVIKILAHWPSRQAVLDDARNASADLDLFAVHRWFQRGSIPSRYWTALLDGASRRGLPVRLDDFASAHAAPGRRGAA